jgi:hypothetical protein
MANPWDIPPRPKRGDRSPTAIYTAVGQTMSAWEYVEFDLADIFAVFAGARVTNEIGSEPAARAYGTIVSYRTRCDVLAAAAKAFFKRNPGTRLERPFRNLLKKCDGWANRRNDVAHGLVLRVQIIPGYCLYPTPYNAKKYPLDSQDAVFIYRASQIRKFVTSIRKLRRQSRNFLSRLDAEIARRQRAREQLAERVRQANERYSRQAQDRSDLQ